MPGLSWELVDYLRMELRLSPNEYLATSRDVYETASAVQAAYREGIEAAREAHRKKQASDEKLEARRQSLLKTVT